VNNQDYIRKAIVLVGWQTTRLGNQRVKVFVPWGEGIVKDIGYIDYPHVKDALAARLREQAQSNPHIVFHINVIDSASYVEMLIYNPNGDEEAKPLRFVGHETEESMAFIKVIMDSQILESKRG